jgi:PAS domain S-box-containing protein
VSKRISVLHCDDDPQFGALVTEYVNSLDTAMTVVSVADAGTAKRELESGGFDCVVSDYDMPETDGLELLSWVRQRDADIPFVLFTGKGSEEVASEAISLGATDYIRKGSDPSVYELLVNRVRNAVQRYRAEQEATRTRRFLEKVVQHATDMIAVVDVEGNVVFVSGSIEEVLGYTPDELYERDAFELIHPDDRAAVTAHFEERLTDPDHPTGIEHRAVHRDGRTVPIYARAYNLVDDPDVDGILIYSRRGETT